MNIDYLLLFNTARKAVADIYDFLIKAAKKVGKEFLNAVKPNETVSKSTIKIIIGIYGIAVLLAWYFWMPAIIPRPKEILNAFVMLWFKEGLGIELLTSFITNLEALALSTFISLGFAYLTVLPAVRPIVALVSKFRFLGLVGLTFLFTILLSGGHGLKIALLTFGMTVFFLTSMAEEVAEIPREKYDHARTLRMGEWRVVWEVIILGKMDAAIEVLRQNAAIGWMMLTMVEGIVRSEGGVGALLLNQNKHLHLDAVFAIQTTILLIALVQDYDIGVIRKMICPHASLVLERR